MAGCCRYSCVRLKRRAICAEAMINYMALLGWSYDDKTEIMSRQELIERFSLERVNASPAVWNYEKLDHLNGCYIRQMPVEDLADRLLPYARAAGLKSSAASWSRSSR